MYLWAPNRAQHLISNLRFIPAGAGNTRLPAGLRHVRPVHPRGCGEYETDAVKFLVHFGSSPRVRGIPSVRPEQHSSTRFIPADAGNTCQMCSSSRRVPVHPRGCGEYGRDALCFCSADGSSPRMRGIHLRREQAAAAWRFIPADAGNTSCTTKVTVAAPVHPRGCGEYLSHHLHAQLMLGSSPRMRGIRAYMWFVIAASRFIPADAGNTEQKQIRIRDVAVHPRGCGEYDCGSVCVIVASGSSPRMRGIRWGPCPRSTSCQVHPRGCGEYFFCF